ncbi:MAG: DJ-1/PfpI family protein [Deltaproteobacteria bacterium]|nr:DJ-1/PfpI family protein [Deltaproteobacteria bacterium]MBT4267388.1 DJ-1/PfpI family protein [Deltaproteobacteria bacterium]MBT4638066.1 DJ-1/PfpI family protein [Deltaproteobacteria bacterium]MBT6612791.1 DJ-1/PfpI family protein [Deltaproteobacteria bacterium]MBT7155145.1 DJ-1/PfpI family protein [Deltaproteobacteria bacterium]
MKEVLLLLIKGTEIFEAAAFYDVLGWAGTHGIEPINVVTAALQEETSCTFGLRVKPDVLISDVNVDNFDALAIPGGFADFGFYDDAYSDEVSGLINEFETKNKIIASICVGALPVANSGILKDRCATTYHLMDGKRRRQLADFGVQVKDQKIVQDGNIITSTSPATALDVAFLLVEKVTTRENADKIRQLMGF